MKEEINNEMDVLLRRLNRRDSTTPPNGENSSASDHLDVDELNAYSENTLPDKTRLRYTEHLADCARCRKLVTQLTQSAAVELPKTEKPQAAWLASFLGRFLSPFTWRFALPALAAVGIVAIGLILLRREPAGEFTAQKASPAATEKPQSNSGVQDGYLNSHPQSSPTTEGTRPTKPVDVPIMQEKNSSDAVASDRGEPAPPKDQATAAAPASVFGPTPSPGASEVAKLDDEQRQQKTEDLKKSKQAEEDRDKFAAAKAPTEMQRADQVRGATPDAENSPTGAYQIRPGVAGTLSTTRRKSELKEEESKNESETKTVAGRQFRKQGNLWMDTAYNSSMPTLTMSRGSESYRALVADEPGIRTIAEQLDGDIVVVWKGKAYRIR